MENNNKNIWAPKSETVNDKLPKEVSDIASIDAAPKLSGKEKKSERKQLKKAKSNAKVKSKGDIKYSSEITTPENPVNKVEGDFCETNISASSLIENSSYEIALNIYKSPINITKDILNNYRKNLIIYLALGIIPGIFFKIAKKWSIPYELSEAHSNLIAAYWKRLSSIQKNCGAPKITTTNNELIVEEETYTSQKLERIMESLNKEDVFAENKFEKPKFYDPSFKLLVERLGIQDFFFSTQNLKGKIDKKWHELETKAIYSEQLSSITTKVLFSFHNSLININNYASYTRLITKDFNDDGEAVYATKSIINSRGVVLKYVGQNELDIPFVIVSKNWDYYEDVYGMDNVDSEIDYEEFKNHFSVFVQEGHDVFEIEDVLTKEFMDSLLTEQKTATPFIMHFETDKTIWVFWQEINDEMIPFSESDLVKFAKDTDYGVNSLCKETFYIKSIFSMIDILFNSAL